MRMAVFIQYSTNSLLHGVAGTSSLMRSAAEKVTVARKGILHAS